MRLYQLGAKPRETVDEAYSRECSMDKRERERERLDMCKGDYRKVDWSYWEEVQLT
jgi:hypothetical protein